MAINWFRIGEKANAAIISYEAGAASRAAKVTRNPQKKAERHHDAKVARRQASYLRGKE